jgi:hypothetical protein
MKILAIKHKQTPERRMRPGAGLHGIPSSRAVTAGERIGVDATRLMEA